MKIFFILFAFFLFTRQQTLNIGGLFSSTMNLANQQMASAAQFAVDEINSAGNLLNLNFTVLFPQDSVNSAILDGIQLMEKLGVAIVLGTRYSYEAVGVSIVSQAYTVPLVSYGATSAVLSDKTKYPYFSRTAPSDAVQSNVLAQMIKYYGFNNIGLIATNDAYGFYGSSFVTAATNLGLSVISVNYIAINAQSNQLVVNAVTKVKNSGAKVLLLFVPASSIYYVYQEIYNQGLVPNNTVIVTADGGAGIFSFQNPVTTQINRTLTNAFNGQISTSPLGGYGAPFQTFCQKWLSLDPNKYPGAGQTISFYPAYAYDAIYLFTYAAQQLIAQGKPITGNNMLSAIKSTTFTGITGFVQLDPTTGDRLLPAYAVNNLVNGAFSIAGTWDRTNNQTTGPTIITPFIWPNGTSSIPNFRPFLTYLNCNSKTVFVSQNITFFNNKNQINGSGSIIAGGYQCDGYLDCDNWFDESGCYPSYLAVYITFGIIVGILGIWAIINSILVLYMWLIQKNERIIAASPRFLLVIFGSAVMGCVTMAVIVGKPSNSQCLAQIWLFNFTFLLIFGAMFAKSFRVWRIFTNETLVKKPISDIQLFGILALLISPEVILLIIWSSVNPPQVVGQFNSDTNLVHQVCSFGSIAFIIIDLAYTALVLLFGVFLAISTRNYNSLFNEATLITTSVYTIALMAIITIAIIIFIQTPFVTFIMIMILIITVVGVPLLLFSTKIYVAWKKKDLIPEIHTNTQKAYRENYVSATENNVDNTEDGTNN